MTKKKLIIGISYNSFNIGNHFFEQSLYYDLKKVFEDCADVILVEGRSFYSEMNLTSKSKYYLNYGKYSKLDYYVLSGPIFQYKTLSSNFGPLFDEMQKNGTKFLFLSAGSSYYSKEEIEEVKCFLQRISPLAISTRDTFTFNAYHDCAPLSHNGICSAFFSSIHYKGYDTPSLFPYIIYNFEDGPEPELDKIKWDNIKDTIFTDKQINDCSRSSSKLGLIKSLLKKYQSSYNDRLIIRTLHNITPSVMKPFLHRPNQFVSVNPFAYLNLFSHAEAVFARRVHACVPALSYGVPAMLFNDTNRSQLFSRVGLKDIHKHPVTLDPNLLQHEYSAFIEFLYKIKDEILRNI